MKNPNGYGCVCKLSGKRRKPFGVRVTVGWSDGGKQLYQNLGYFKTRPEAMIALAEYNKDPYTLDASTVTFTEIYDRWSERKFQNTSKSNVGGYKAVYKISESLYDMKFTDIRKAHLQAVIDNCDKGFETLRKIKNLFNQLYTYAAENDITDKNYARFVDIGKHEDKPIHKPFTAKEIKLLFDSMGQINFIDTVLIMIYTGLRISELLLIENINVDLEKRIMRGGIKTSAGKNRIIPINKKILPLITQRKAEGHKYLIINSDNKKMSYWNYTKDRWSQIMAQLKMDHLTHDCRHTFATLMDNAGANKVSIQRIMGHASKDITDKVYTHKDIEELVKAIDLI